jgi:uncharacterized membrane protein YgcG
MGRARMRGAAAAAALLWATAGVFSFSEPSTARGVEPPAFLSCERLAAAVGCASPHLALKDGTGSSVQKLDDVSLGHTGWRHELAAHDIRTMCPHVCDPQLPGHRRRMQEEVPPVGSWSGDMEFEVPEVPEAPNVTAPAMPNVPNMSDYDLNCTGVDCMDQLGFNPFGNTSAEVLDNEYTDLGGQFAKMLVMGENCNETCRSPKCQGDNCTRVPPVPLGPTAILLRIMPMASSTFVTFFGSKIATVVRVMSCFWASAAPSGIVVLKQIKIEQTVTAATFVGLAGAAYAGGLGAFAAVKSKKTGITVQSMAVGYVLSSVLQGFALGILLEKHPEAEEYMEWITLAFTATVGATVAKFALKYEDILSIFATACMGAYTQLQVVCSFGFEFTEGLTIQAAMGGYFGCLSWPCNVTLCGAIGYALLGARNQMKMNSLAKKIEADPDFAGTGYIEMKLVRLNKVMAIVFTLNEIVKEQGAYHTEEEMKELLEQNMAIMLQLSTVGTNIGLVVLAMSMFTGTVEGFTSGAFVFSDGSGKLPALTWFALALGFIGCACIGLVYFTVKTHQLPHAEAGKRETRQKIFLLLASFVMPIVAGCSLVILVMQDGSPIPVPQVKRYFDLEKVPGEQREALEDMLPTVFVSLQGVLITLAMSWTIICKHLGGKLYLAMKFLSMITWVIFFVGAAVAYAGHWGIESSGLTGCKVLEVFTCTPIDEDVMRLFVFLGIVGCFLVCVAAWGLFGMFTYYKVRALGRIQLRIYSIVLLVMMLLNIMLFAVVGYYVTNLDDLIENDWAKLESFMEEKRSGVLANDTRFEPLHDLDMETFRNETKTEFVETVKGSFNVMMVGGGVVTALLVMGFIAANFLVRTDNPIPGKNEKPKGDSSSKDDDKNDDKNDDGGGGGGDSGGGGGGDDGGGKKGKKDKPSKEEKKKAKEEKKAAKKKARQEKRALRDAAKQEELEKKAKEITSGGDGDAAAAGGKGGDESTTEENPLAGGAAAAAGGGGSFEVESNTNDLSRLLNEGGLKAQAEQLSPDVLGQVVKQLQEVLGVDGTFEKEGKKKDKKKDKKKKDKKKKDKPSSAAKDAAEAEKLKNLWATLDSDGSGALDKNEVREVMKSMGKDLDDAQLDAAMAEIDKDGSGEVEYEEFLVWWQGQDPEAQKQLMLLNELNFDDL